MFRLIAVSALLALSTVSASRDDEYYPGGIQNPNVNAKNSMFWREGYNVLQDIDSFDKLYVKFHSCAWSEYLADFENSGDGDGDDWYLSSVPNFRANVAFSLYGVPKRHRDSKCSKATFINSFYTTGGIESFTNALAYAGVSGFTVVDEEGDEGNSYGTPTSMCDGDGEDRRKLGEDGGYENGGKMSYGSYSTGVGCDGSKFTSFQFGGGVCDGNDVLAVLDPLESFNEQMEDVDCVQIYSSGDYYSNDDEESASPLAVLEKSQACSTHDLVGKCPDPFGRIARYEAALECAIDDLACSKARSEKIRFLLHFAGGVMIVASIIMFFVVYFIGNWAAKAANDKITRSPKDKKRKKKKSKKTTKGQKASREPSLTPVVSEDVTAEEEELNTRAPAWVDSDLKGAGVGAAAVGAGAAAAVLATNDSEEQVYDPPKRTGNAQSDVEYGHPAVDTSPSGYTSGGGYTSGEGDTTDYDTENEDKAARRKDKKKKKKKRGFFSRFRRKKSQGD